ncbi:MAG TPA: hypothetical protein VF796_05935 [Humisphaera sp.]
MLSERHDHTPKPFIPPTGAAAHLHIDGKLVGTIEVTGWDSTWTHGRFTPTDGFAPYATVFGRWSLLMHEDEHAPLHGAAQAALADTERQIDMLHVRVYFPKEDQWHEVRQLNIDGGTVEWKEV